MYQNITLSRSPIWICRNIVNNAAVQTAIDRNDKPLCIFLDLNKAFDTVNHTKLMTTLKNSGIWKEHPGTSLNLTSLVGTEHNK